MTTYTHEKIDEAIDALEAGATDREIADALVMALHTAHKHVRNVLSKLGLRSTAELTKHAIEQGLI